jgi:hypothetical protein
MARAGYRIFDADTHIIEAAEPIEAYLSAADKARLAGLGALVGRAAGKGGVSRYRVGKRPELNRLLGSRDSVPPADAIARGLKDGGTPWERSGAISAPRDPQVGAACRVGARARPHAPRRARARRPPRRGASRTARASASPARSPSLSRDKARSSCGAT